MNKSLSSIHIISRISFGILPVLAERSKGKWRRETGVASRLCKIIETGTEIKPRLTTNSWRECEERALDGRTEKQGRKRPRWSRSRAGARERGRIIMETSIFLPVVLDAHRSLGGIGAGLVRIGDFGVESAIVGGNLRGLFTRELVCRILCIAVAGNGRAA